MDGQPKRKQWTPEETNAIVFKMCIICISFTQFEKIVLHKSDIYFVIDELKNLKHTIDFLNNSLIPTFLFCACEELFSYIKCQKFVLNLCKYRLYKKESFYATPPLTHNRSSGGLIQKICYSFL